MRTLTLLSACLLLALMAQAEPHPGQTDQVDTERLSEGEDHVTVLSFLDKKKIPVLKMQVREVSSTDTVFQWEVRRWAPELGLYFSDYLPAFTWIFLLRVQ